MCWEVRHTDILILLHAGSTLPYGSKEGCRDAPPPPAEKKPFLQKIFLFSTRVRPLVMAGPLSPSHMLLGALFLATIMRVPWCHSSVNLLCLRHLLAGCSRGVGTGGAELQLHDSAQGLHPPSMWLPGGRLGEFYFYIQLCWNNSTKRLVQLSQYPELFLVYAKWELVSLLRFLLG